MFYIVESGKIFDQASADLETAVKRNGFGVLHIHDLGNTLRGKGVAFGKECRILEICNPIQAAKVLSSDMRLTMALPCRVSVFTEGGLTKIGFLSPVQMLSSLSEDPALTQVAEEVEQKIKLMVDEAL